ncbi:anthrone oxygenase family protein [Fodinicola feengrottensis]|uniref:DUF1772 domain-containing protein n=1 Tax=Fodinicola feengrottensis TaxID=435914 RepID=A0ABN2FYC7_9ACTN|nr:anthrone oxygenase family protein [Fodinicola feengrottensis]
MLSFLRVLSLIAATLTTGLIAGLFYGFCCAVMPGLAASSDRTFIETMQNINVAILNGWFFLTFMGALLTAIVAAALHMGGSGWRVFPWILAAVLFYLVTFVVTIAANVPLNDALMAAGDPAKIGDLAAVRHAFENAWLGWNLVRALTNTAAFGCLAWALVMAGRTTA